MEKTNSRDFQGRLARIEELIRAVDAIADETPRTQARELVEALLELQGAGLERLMELIYETGPSGQAMIDELAATNWFPVCSLSMDFIRSISNRRCGMRWRKSGRAWPNMAAVWIC